MLKGIREKVLLAMERTYPYIIAGIGTYAIWKYGAIDFLSSKNLNDALTAIITVSSIIIGFMGTILPVILSMKNDSKVVQYVFQRDKHRLFLKYIKSALGLGIALILCSIIPYFEDLFEKTALYKYLPYAVIYLLISFLCATFRCLNNMLNLIFKADGEIKESKRSEKKEESEQKKMLDRKIRERQNKENTRNI